MICFLQKIFEDLLQTFMLYCDSKIPEVAFVLNYACWNVEYLYY